MTDNNEPEKQDPDNMQIREGIESVTVYNPMTQNMDCIPVGYSVDASGYAIHFRGVALPRETDPWDHAVEREKMRRAEIIAKDIADIKSMFSAMRNITGLKQPGGAKDITEEMKP